MRRRLLQSITLLVIGGCALSGPDDAPFLAALGFDKPVTFQWQPPVFTNTNFNRGNDNTALAALLVKEGALTVQPDSKPPWWHFATADGQDPQGPVTFTIGTRQIDGRSEIKHWQEGSVDNFAETVAYHIQLVDGFQKAGIPYAQSFSARVLAVNNPSVGHWELASGADTLNDVQNIQSGLTELGRNYVDDMKGAVNLAMKPVADGIESDLKNSGVLARTDQDPHVLISKRANVYIYSGMIPIAGHTIDQLEGLCGALQTKIGGPWHAPIYQDLLNTIVNQGNGSGWIINDTPDRRLLGELIGNQGGSVRFQPKDYQPSGNSPAGYILELNEDGYLSSAGYYVYPGQMPAVLDGTSRLLCMSSTIK